MIKSIFIVLIDIAETLWRSDLLTAFDNFIQIKCKWLTGWKHLKHNQIKKERLSEWVSEWVKDKQGHRGASLLKRELMKPCPGMLFILHLNKWKKINYLMEIKWNVALCKIREFFKKV